MGFVICHGSIRLLLICLRLKRRSYLNPKEGQLSINLSLLYGFTSFLIKGRSPVFLVDNKYLNYPKERSSDVFCPELKM